MTTPAPEFELTIAGIQRSLEVLSEQIEQYRVGIHDHSGVPDWWEAECQALTSRIDTAVAGFDLDLDFAIRATTLATTMTAGGATGDVAERLHNPRKFGHGLVAAGLEAILNAARGPESGDDFAEWLDRQRRLATGVDHALSSLDRTETAGLISDLTGALAATRNALRDAEQHRDRPQVPAGAVATAADMLTVIHHGLVGDAKYLSGGMSAEDAQLLKLAAIRAQGDDAVHVSWAGILTGIDTLANHMRDRADDPTFDVDGKLAELIADSVNRDIDRVSPVISADRLARAALNTAMLAAGIRLGDGDAVVCTENVDRFAGALAAAARTSLTTALEGAPRGVDPSLWRETLQRLYDAVASALASAPLALMRYPDARARTEAADTLLSYAAAFHGIGATAQIKLPIRTGAVELPNHIRKSLGEMVARTRHHQPDTATVLTQIRRFSPDWRPRSTPSTVDAVLHLRESTGIADLDDQQVAAVLPSSRALREAVRTRAGLDSLAEDPMTAWLAQFIANTTTTGTAPASHDRLLWSTVAIDAAAQTRPHPGASGQHRQGDSAAVVVDVVADCAPSSGSQPEV